MNIDKAKKEACALSKYIQTLYNSIEKDGPEWQRLSYLRTEILKEKIKEKHKQEKSK